MDDTLAAIVSGAVGTVAVGLVLLATEARSGFGVHVFLILADLVGTDSLAVGSLLFLAGGTVAWPLLYVTLGRYLPGEGPVRGMVFAVVLWIGFAPGFSGGTAGAAAPAFADGSSAELLMYLIVTLFAHLVYGAILGGGHVRFSDQAY